MTPWILRLRVGLVVWVATMAMGIPVGIAVLFALLVNLEISWGESVDRGTVVLLVAICGVIVGTGAGVTVKWTRGHVRRVSNGALHAEPAVTACALAVAGFLILVERGLLRESAGSVAVLMAAPPLAAAVAAHSSWPDSALTVAVLVAAAAAVVTVLLGF